MIRDDRGCNDSLSPTLLVLLPGANMRPEELVQQGLVAAVRQRQRAVDLALPDAHLGYVYDGSCKPPSRYPRKQSPPSARRTARITARCG